MNAESFVDYFNLIKPTPEEILKSVSTVAPEIFDEILNEYDLKIISKDFHSQPLIDIIKNTNIADLYFSQLRFYNDCTNNSQLFVGDVIEKGELFFNRLTGEVSFVATDESFHNLEGNTDQLDFLNFCIKYFELNFNKVFRNGLSTAFITQNISLPREKVKKFPVFKVLLEEIGVSLDQF